VIEHAAKPNELRRLFEFNRFQVTLEFETMSALVEDILQPGPSGEARMNWMSSFGTWRTHKGKVGRRILRGGRPATREAAADA
jgi:hypothetical protein